MRSKQLREFCYNGPQWHGNSQTRVSALELAMILMNILGRVLGAADEAQSPHLITPGSGAGGSSAAPSGALDLLAASPMDPPRGRDPNSTRTSDAESVRSRSVGPVEWHPAMQSRPCPARMSTHQSPSFRILRAFRGRCVSTSVIRTVQDNSAARAIHSALGSATDVGGRVGEHPTARLPDGA